MKLLLKFGIWLCLSTPLFANLTFRDDAPAGFIHMTYPNQSPKLDPVDVFIPTRNIVEIKIDSYSDDSVAFFTVRIKTNGTTAGAQMSASMSYDLSFKTKPEAMKCATDLMRICSAGEQAAARPKTK